MPRKNCSCSGCKKKEPSWEELLDSLVAKEANPDGYYAKTRESIRAYVKDLELKVEELENTIKWLREELSALDQQCPLY